MCIRDRAKEGFLRRVFEEQASKVIPAMAARAHPTASSRHHRRFMGEDGHSSRASRLSPLLKILLVVFLRSEEGADRHDLSDDRARQGASPLQFPFRFHRRLLLGFAMEEDRGGMGMDRKPRPSETYRIFSAELIIGEKGKLYSTLNNLFELLGKRREKIQFS